MPINQVAKNLLYRATCLAAELLPRAAAFVHPTSWRSEIICKLGFTSERLISESSGVSGAVACPGKYKWERDEAAHIYQASCSSDKV